MDRYLNPAELERLLNTVRKVNDPLAQRDYHIIGALANCGARIHEFSMITVGQAVNAIKTSHLFFPREHRKGRRARVNSGGVVMSVDRRKDHEVYVNRALKGHLQALLDRCDGRCDFNAPLIAGRFGQTLTVRAYQLRIQMWADVAGLGLKVTPHWFRHTLAMNIMRESTAREPLVVVQRVLGHSNINSSAIYAHATREEVEHVLDAVADVGQGKRRMSLGRLRKQHERGE